MEWQTIDSAPKNPEGARSGPAILLWSEYDHKVYHGFWTTHIANGLLTSGWAIWSPTEAKYPINPQHKITHWMPQPEPPQ